MMCKSRMLWGMLTGLALLSAPAGVRAGPDFLVSSRLSRTEAGLFLLSDLNGDGDALDVAERVLWGRGLGGPGDVRVLGNAVIAADPVDGRLVRFRDLNGDGDALDSGESVTWADALVAPMGFDAHGEDAVIAADLATDTVYRFLDVNGDGDALDSGERVPFATGIDAPVSVLDGNGEVFVTSDSGGGVYRLVDVNGDGDAMDAAETVTYSAAGRVATSGLLRVSDEILLLSIRADDTVFQVQDRNGDGDALDIVELVSYADPVFGHLDEPWNMVSHPDGGTLLVENGRGRVSLMFDVNGDGDALDVGEVTAWAEGLDVPVGLAALPPPLMLLLGDANNDGMVTGLDLIAVQQNFGRAGPPFDGTLLGDANDDGQVTGLDLISVQQNFGNALTMGDAPVPEPAGLAIMLGAMALVGRGRPSGE